MKSIKYVIGSFIVAYFMLIGLNATIGYGECKALNIHNDDLDAFNPCVIAYNIRN